MKPPSQSDAARLRNELAESDAAVKTLVSTFNRDLKRAEARRRRLDQKLKVALDEGFGVFFDTEAGSWQPRRQPLSVVVVKHDAAQDAPLAEVEPLRPDGCSCGARTGFHASTCATVRLAA